MKKILPQIAIDFITSEDPSPDPPPLLEVKEEPAGEIIGRETMLVAETPPPAAIAGALSPPPAAGQEKDDLENAGQQKTGLAKTGQEKTDQEKLAETGMNIFHAAGVTVRLKSLKKEQPAPAPLREKAETIDSMATPEPPVILEPKLIPEPAVIPVPPVILEPPATLESTEIHKTPETTDTQEPETTPALHETIPETPGTPETIPAIQETIPAIPETAEIMNTPESQLSREEVQNTPENPSAPERQPVPNNQDVQNNQSTPNSQEAENIQIVQGQQVITETETAPAPESPETLPPSVSEISQTPEIQDSPEAVLPAESKPGKPAPPIKSTRGRKSLKQTSAEADLIEIPGDEVLFSKQYYTMGEVAEMFRVNQSLLRFWEAEFDVLKPRKNKKGDRYFRPVDIKNLHLIYHLLRQRKYTIEGAKDFLKKNRKAEERFEAIQNLHHIKAFLLEWKAQL